jgi:hypothetical protein
VFLVQKLIALIFRKKCAAAGRRKPQDQQAPPAQAIVVAWNRRCDDLFVDLLFAISTALGFQFTKVELRRGIYYPRGHFELETAQKAILANVGRLLAGELALPMKVTEFPVSADALEKQTRLQVQLLEALHDGKLHVSVEEKNKADAEDDSSQTRDVRTRDHGPYPLARLPRPSGLLRLRPLSSQRGAKCRLVAQRNSGAVAVSPDGVHAMRNDRRRCAAGWVAAHKSANPAKAQLIEGGSNGQHRRRRTERGGGSRKGHPHAIAINTEPEHRSDRQGSAQCYTGRDQRKAGSDQFKRRAY